MSSRRTEAPTPRRIRRARELGQVATSRELTSAVSLAAALVALLATGRSTTRAVADGLRTGLVRALDPDAAPWPALLDAFVLLARAAAPVCAAAMMGAGLAAAIQAGGLFAPAALRFRWDRLDPFRGASRLVSPARLATLGTGIAKTVAILVLGWWMVPPQAAAIAALARTRPGALIEALPALLVPLLAALAGAALAFGALDLRFQMRRHRRSLRMTPEEVRRDHREDAGDPRHRAERRRLHRALAGASPLVRAACVVVNPTHVAVALEHARGSDDAPVVIAKAMGHAAGRLRGAARRAGIPVVRDVHLARALYRLAEIGEEIPVELYEAAAAVLAHVYGSAREAHP